MFYAECQICKDILLFMLMHDMNIFVRKSILIICRLAFILPTNL